MRGLRFLVAVALLPALAAVAGCTPREVFLAAAGWSDGQPVVILAPCKGSKVTQVALYEESGSAWEVTNDAGVDYAEFPVFSTPAGWTQTIGELRELRDDTSYAVLGKISGHPPVAGVRFTRPQLRELGPDEVLARPGKTAEKMSKAAYRKFARGAC